MRDAPQYPVPPLPVSDAPPRNWVDRHAPAATRPYLRLSRADRPIGSWLLAIPCLWGLSLSALPTGFRLSDLWLVLACGAGAVLMRGAGCTWNDISDREIDAAVARTQSRPLPSGQITLRAALIWMVVQAGLAGLILLSLNAIAIALGIGSLGLVAIYPFAKRFTWWPQAFLGLAFNWGVLLAFAAHAGHLTIAALLLYGAGIAWTLFYDTVYAHQDKDDDALIGVKSTARLFGTRTRPWLAGFLLVSVALMAGAVMLALPDASSAKGVVAFGGVLGFGCHMIWQLRHLNTGDAANCLAIFRSNRDAGLLAALFLAFAALL